MKKFIKRVIVLLLVIAQLLPVYQIPAARAADKIDSKIRFNDFYGEVKIRPDAEEDDSYEFVDLDTVIYEGDRIKTEEDSGAILGLEDMSTYVIKPESTLIIHTDEGNVSKIEMLAGSMWGNIKKISEGKSLEIEMSQCVCGITGTTIYAETSGTDQQEQEEQKQEKEKKQEEEKKNSKNIESIIQNEIEKRKSEVKKTESPALNDAIQNILTIDLGLTFDDKATWPSEEVKENKNINVIEVSQLQSNDPILKESQLQTFDQINTERPQLITLDQKQEEDQVFQMPQLQTFGQKQEEDQVFQMPQLQTFDQEYEQQTEMEKVLASLPKVEPIELKFSSKELEALHNVFNKNNNNNNNNNNNGGKLSEEEQKKQVEEKKRQEEEKKRQEEEKKRQEEEKKRQEEEKKRQEELKKQQEEEKKKQEEEQKQQAQQNKGSVPALTSTGNNSQTAGIVVKYVSPDKKNNNNNNNNNKIINNIFENNNNITRFPGQSEEIIQKSSEEQKKREEEKRKKKEEDIKRLLENLRQKQEKQKQEEERKKQEEEKKKQEEQQKKQIKSDNQKQLNEQVENEQLKKLQQILTERQQQALKEKQAQQEQQQQSQQNNEPQEIAIKADVHPNSQEIVVKSEVHPNSQEIVVKSEVHPNSQEIDIKSDVVNNSQQNNNTEQNNKLIQNRVKKYPNVNKKVIVKKKKQLKKNGFKLNLKKVGLKPDTVKVIKGTAHIKNLATGETVMVPAGYQATINGNTVDVKTIENIENLQNELNQQLDRANDKLLNKELIEKLNGQTGQINDAKKSLDDMLNTAKKIVESNIPSEKLKSAFSIYNKAVEDGKRFVSIFVEINSTISVLNKRLSSKAENTVVVTKDEADAADEAIKNANSAMTNFSQSLDALVAFADKIEEKLGFNPLDSLTSQVEKAKEIKDAIEAAGKELDEDIVKGITDESSYSDFKDAVARCEALLKDLQRTSQNIKADEVGRDLADALKKQYEIVSDRIEKVMKDYSSVPEVKSATLSQMNDFEMKVPGFSSDIRKYLSEYNAIERSSTDAKKRYVESVTRTLASYDRMRRVYTKANRMYTQMEKEFKLSKFKTSEYNDVKESWEKIEKAMTEIDSEASELSSCVENLKSQLERLLGQ